jgi:hypothetical protein
VDQLAAGDLLPDRLVTDLLAGDHHQGHLSGVIGAHSQSAGRVGVIELGGGAGAAGIAPMQEEWVVLGVAEGPDVAELAEHEVEAVDLILLDHLPHRRLDAGANVATGIPDRKRNQGEEALGIGFAHHHRPVGAEPLLDPV